MTRRATPRALLALASAALLLAACSGTTQTVAPINTKPGPDQYLNPVIDADFPDPTVIRASDGFYYAYATQTTGVHIQVARSSDLVAWTRLPDALPAKPAWAQTSNNFWAPDVHEHGGTYVMYFASQNDTTSGMCVGMATATTGAGPFTDVGHPVLCGPNATAIDPMAFDDPQSGKSYLYWGSSGAPISVRELAADGQSFAAGSSPTALVSPGSGSYDANLVEGPWVTYHAPYYYLFFSGNNCCGAGAHYAVMVARSSSPTGPFEELMATGGGAQPILRAGGKWTAPGHNSVVTDVAGTDWMLYHAIDVSQPYLIPGRTDISRRPMLLDRITYANGWPTVGTAGFPTSTPQTRPATTAPATTVH